ncbi:hypothetical protein NKR19_g10270 [Coniochaeta hoffmannii]|uniref:Uncharacterized protein n=1 Tax=Coniochaeta hoffmannii TaxID=91930 RepID=A0AA38R053_9PEZI|nr:hypothetical protein NKR19_g10270 [Coniochaeta hoffmannii]
MTSSSTLVGPRAATPFLQQCSHAAAAERRVVIHLAILRRFGFQGKHYVAHHGRAPHDLPNLDVAGIFPAAAKEEINKALKRNFPASWFRDSHDDDDPAVAEELLIQTGSGNHHRALAELAHLQQIKTRAIEPCWLGQVRALLEPSTCTPFVPEMNDYAEEQCAEKKIWLSSPWC